MMNPSAKKILSALLLYLLTTNMNAQQEAQSALYMFNPASVNPAYAGSREAISGVMDYRQQWVKWDGAPTTAMLNIHSPLKMDALALGLNLQNDKIGSTTDNSISGDIAYRVRLNERNDKLSFGLRLGCDYYATNISNLKATDLNDQIKATNNYTALLFNAGAGIYYYGKKHYIGISTPRLIQNKRINNIADIKSLQLSHYYFVAGYVFTLNSMVVFKPSIQLKYTQNTPLSVDVNASFLFAEKFWIGAMYRHHAAIGANIMYQISDVLRVGYAYDYTTTAMTKYGPNSHEIMVGFDLTRKRDKFNYKTPRYF